ncbi:uncharacterized protein YdcI [Diabrotica virgifera virgifera]|uniref:S1 motif domain-containing protein n=1 Tax=Diabrotica virgifera virgifera TaxID=50390 RepID=A0ABM5IAP9_DIAVI|nr:uncharacterized protein YdcI [Diabrotica virgifera virgifera]
MKRSPRVKTKVEPDMSSVMISDDEDLTMVMAHSPPKRITRERRTKYDKKFYALELTSDEDEISDKEDKDATFVLDDSVIEGKKETSTKSKPKRNLNNSSLVEITDDESDVETPVKKTKKRAPVKTKQPIVKAPIAKAPIKKPQVKKEPAVKKPRVKKEPTVRKTQVKKEPTSTIYNEFSSLDETVRATNENVIQDGDETLKTASARTNLKRKNSKVKAEAKSDLNPPKAKKLKTEINLPSTSLEAKHVNLNCETTWKDHELLAENMNLSKHIAYNVINLFNDGSTIPFIARYRRTQTGNMTPEDLRDVKSAYDDICTLKQKIKTVVNTLEKTGQKNRQIELIVKSSKSLEELEIIYAPYKPEAKRTLAERAKSLGLEQPATALFDNTCPVDLNQWVDASKEELKSLEDVQNGVIHIIAHKIATDSDMLSFLRDLRQNINFTLETKKLNAKQPKAKTKKSVIQEKPVDELKFQTYFDYSIPVKFIKPHQVLAINRGEHHKVLSVKISPPPYLIDTYKKFCLQKYINRGVFNEDRRTIVGDACIDAFSRLLLPSMVREVRSELKIMAEKASYEVFSKNLKQILLAAPIKGERILGIDPGYHHGCKLALISSTGKVLDQGVIFPHSVSDDNRDKSKTILKDLLDRHDCSLIGLGDGKASKQTEEWLSNLIRNKYFHPKDVKYTIVTEDGASVYSCSAEAKKEFPQMDTNIISAVSLARRIQDPLAELVKVEPKHLGVGMYQHDLKKKTLEEALDEVVSECVSFVGVDLNTASQCLLRRIAGITDKRATEIIKFRETNGAFICRDQLLKVPGIGPKAFEQCAGFLRIVPTNTASPSKFSKNYKITKLDQTIIHPESYDLTKKLLKSLKLNEDHIGEETLIQGVQAIKTELPEVCEKLDTNVETLNLIIDALEKPLNYDFRTEGSQNTFFAVELKDFDDVSVDDKMVGRVKNVTHFGCFVDIGISQDALIHSSKMNGLDLQIGDRVNCIVITVDKLRKRIGLKALSKQ